MLKTEAGRTSGRDLDIYASLPLADLLQRTQGMLGLAFMFLAIKQLLVSPLAKS